ncbi:MAG TPA: ATP-dependent DNA helicase RecG, partial [Candidatus Binatia bacterium]|nr:ATP-dependent DNA helicase RecG [Candidatus Binatia bacterium]
MSRTPNLALSTPLKSLPGVGPERASQLARLRLFTVEELLLHRPWRYEDRRHLLRIRQLEVGRAATTRGRIVAQGLKTYRQRTKSVFEFVLEDGTGRLHCRWWNLPFMEKYFAVDDEVMVFGKLKSVKPRIIDHPETEVIETGDELFIHIDRIAPIYPLTEGMPQRWLRGLIWRTLAGFEDQIGEPWPGLVLPALPTRAKAVRQLHFPEELPDAEQARERLALDEFLDLQVAIQRRRKNLQTQARGLPCGGDNRLIKPFLRLLNFELTAAQTRVLRELRRDLSGPHPMRRLVQGEVGSGKTVVAACCALMAIESGFNVALMAPTEVLAEQHDQTFARWFEPLGVPVELQTGSRKTWRTPRATAARPGAPGRPPPLRPGASLCIGTHALIESAFELPNLGLVLIDEQHKFGVAQRENLVRKGHYPHLLVMTATPIPRTLGLTIYGDLDHSILDELPPGRGQVRTFVRSAAQLPKVHAFIRQKITEGRQAYIVFPRVEEGDAPAGLKAVTQECERLQAVFAPHRVELLHGRLRPEEKERVMRGFRDNEVRVLLATSIIEVGVDVPNATVMLIENADRFGLAQLHQLRGRIGRGAHESYCILMAERATEEARRRLNVLASSNDGFQIAEADLQLRGPGELLGQHQSGAPPLRFGDLRADRAL